MAEQVRTRLGAVAFTEDIAGPGAAQRAVDLAVERYGALDIVVNNAAILRDGFIFKTARGLAARDRHQPHRGLRYAWRRPRRSCARPPRRAVAPGRIVNLVSTAGLYGNFGQAAYAAAKAGLVG